MLLSHAPILSVSERTRIECITSAHVAIDAFHRFSDSVKIYDYTDIGENVTFSPPKCECEILLIKHDKIQEGMFSVYGMLNKLNVYLQGAVQE
jgi:hypothetical protein